MINQVAVHGYRSLRDVSLELGRVTVVTGGNGSGKSSLYRSLRLLAETAQGNLVASLARSGGFQQVLWAGPEQITGAMRRGEQPVQGTGKRIRPVSLMLGFAGDDLGYLIDLGLPQMGQESAFSRDPVIKRELIFAPPVMRPASLLVRRKNAKVDVRDRSWRTVTEHLGDRDSLLSEIADPNLAPEVLQLRQQVRSWRFYDGFRTDAEAPARQRQVGTWTPVMAADGSDLVAAVQTILESAFRQPFEEAMARAFDGTQVQVIDWELAVTQPGMLRPMTAAELSDGTLRFILLATALLSPRPPELLVLNEPEASLHPSLLPSLASMISTAAERTQVVVVSHSEAIVAQLAASHGSDLVHHRLTKSFGETVLEGRDGLFDRPIWDWGTR